MMAVTRFNIRVFFVLVGTLPLSGCFYDFALADSDSDSSTSTDANDTDTDSDSETEDNGGPVESDHVCFEKECTTPPANECLPDDQTLRIYEKIGWCEDDKSHYEPE